MADHHPRGRHPAATPPAMQDTAAAVTHLADLSLTFGRVERLTRHQDGTTPESDTDHTVMLGLIACAFAAAHLPDLDVGLVAQYALVHDLVEVYAGDTPTLRKLSAQEQAAKTDRERAAHRRIDAELGRDLPWVPATIGAYEARTSPEARYVKAVDKLLPKITHILNGCATIHEHGMDAADLEARFASQLEELRHYAADFPAVFDLREHLIAAVAHKMGPPPVGPPAPVHPLRRIEPGVWASADGRWRFCRHFEDPAPQRWLAYLDDASHPTNDGEGHTTLRDVAAWAATHTDTPSTHP